MGERGGRVGEQNCSQIIELINNPDVRETSKERKLQELVKILTKLPSNQDLRSALKPKLIVMLCFCSENGFLRRNTTIHDKK
jgi:hypothetical protein